MENIGAPNKEVALENLQKVHDIGLTGKIEELEAIDPYEGDNIPYAMSYYSNQTTYNIYDLQESKRKNPIRIDDEGNEDINKYRNVFLAQEKYFGSADNPEYKRLRSYLSAEEISSLPEELKHEPKAPRPWRTTHICIAVLSSICITLVALSTFIVARSNKKIS